MTPEDLSRFLVDHQHDIDEKAEIEVANEGHEERYLVERVVLDPMGRLVLLVRELA